MNENSNQNDSPIKAEMLAAWQQMLEMQALMAKNAEETAELTEQQARYASVMGDSMRAFFGHVSRLD